MKFCITSVAAFFCLLTQVNAQLDVADLISSLENSGRPQADLREGSKSKSSRSAELPWSRKRYESLDLVAIGGLVFRSTSYCCWTIWTSHYAE